MMDIHYEMIKYTHVNRMLFICLLRNAPTVFLAHTVRISPAQPSLVLAEQFLGGVETEESLTLFPLRGA